MLIAHATDLTGDDDLAFLHAAALAARSAARLVTLHANPHAGAAARLPDAGPLAVRWGRPIEHERRCHECCDDVAESVVDAVRGLAPHLLVLGTHARRGAATLLHGSLGEAIARNVTTPSLVVPNAGRGFVDGATGALTLRRVVVPAGTLRDARRGIAAARWLLASVDALDAALEVVHAGAELPELAALGLPVTWSGGPLPEVVSAAATHADLVVMSTDGHDGPLDVLRGSRTERVLREVGCPVLVVPA